MRPFCALVAVLPLLALGSTFAACDDSDGGGGAGVGGLGGSAGTSGKGGSFGTGGSSGTGGRAGSAGLGGSAGKGGAAGMGGAAGLGGASGQGGLGGAGGGVPCTPSNKCDDDSYCDFPLNDCGASDTPGVCRPRLRQGCSNEPRPVCTCDGTLYDSECEAHLAGRDIALLSCAPPEGMFGCGPHFCPLNSMYCRHTGPATGGESVDYSCAPLPAACSGMGTCSCVASDPCASDCTDTGGAVTVNCHNN